MKLYKFTTANGEPCNGGSGKWSLPRGSRPGAWRAVTGVLEPCSNGLHLCRAGDLLNWLGEAMWKVEHDGEIVKTEDKVVVRKARLIRRVEAWNDKTARLFAVHCAAHVLPLYETPSKNDRRVRDCILVARRFALGQATPAELHATGAAWAAARGAAEAATGAAAWDAARAAARAAAMDAAEAAARGAAKAAEAAAWAAAWDAAGAAERKWQLALLLRALKNPKILERLPVQLKEPKA